MQLEEEVLPFSVQCFMKVFGITINTASKKLHEMIEDAWKDTNEEWISPTTIPRIVVEIPFNLSRMMETIYKHNDGYNDPTSSMKDNIIQLLVQPLLI